MSTEHGTPLQMIAASKIIFYETPRAEDDAKHYVEICKLLLDHGANVNSKGGKYGSPLLAALQECRLSVVKLLLEYGADVNAEDEIHGRPLQVAARHRRTYPNSLEVVETIQVLLDHGADINASSSAHPSALRAAVDARNDAACRLLLERGATL